MFSTADIFIRPRLSDFTAFCGCFSDFSLLDGYCFIIHQLTGFISVLFV